MYEACFNNNFMPFVPFFRGKDNRKQSYFFVKGNVGEFFYLLMADTYAWHNCTIHMYMYCIHSRGPILSP
jgi:hypothetical protein